MRISLGLECFGERLSGYSFLLADAAFVNFLCKCQAGQTLVGVILQWAHVHDHEYLGVALQVVLQEEGQFRVAEGHVGCLVRNGAYARAQAA